jgi:hypothetical protein
VMRRQVICNSIIQIRGVWQGRLPGLLASIVMLSAGLAILGGCAAHTWAPGPGMSAVDFEPAKARCSLMARHGGGTFIAVGSPSYVAGAQLGNAIGEAARTQQDFNECMIASGWRIADGQTVAAQNALVAQLKAFREEREACVETVRSRPEYTPIRSHFVDLRTGFTMEQLTDEGTPTVGESRLWASYADAASPCLERQIAQASHLVPPLGLILHAAKASAADIGVLLVERKITWGEAAQRQKRAGEDTIDKIREAHL